MVAAALPDTIAPGSFFEGFEWPIVVWDDQAGLTSAGITALPATSIVDRKCQVVMKVTLITDSNQMMLESAIAVALR
ncbi:hypothetical protein ACFL3H_01400 [Gemmatimonadota bacterium]